MYSVFRRLGKSEYWQIVLRKATWSQARIQLSRIHKDKRARRYLLGIAALLVIPVILFAYLAWLIGSGAIFVVPFVIPVLWWRRRQQRKEEPLHIAPSPDSETPALSIEAAENLLSYLVDVTLVHAILIKRASSEGFLKQKELPQGVEVISRRILLDLLKSRGLWEKISSCDRDAMMMADGHWEWEMINQAVAKTEELRLLRWILGVDAFLPAVGSQLDFPISYAVEIAENPDKLLKAKLRDLSDVRVAQHTAEVYFLRCLAEGVARGIFTAPSEHIRAWAGETADALGGNHNEDLLLGRDLVSEASTELLMQGFERARLRNNFLEWVISILEAGAPPAAPLNVLSGGPSIEHTNV